VLVLFAAFLHADGDTLLGDSMNLWADLQFAPATDGSLTWKLKNYGVNP